jgi:hypothetical protein
MGKVVFFAWEILRNRGWAEHWGLLTARDDPSKRLFVRQSQFSGKLSISSGTGFFVRGWDLPFESWINALLLPKRA